MAIAVLSPNQLSPEQIKSSLAGVIAAERVLIRPIDLIAFAADASFYRLIPKAVVQAQGLEEIQSLFAFSQQTQIPMTFRAAGTSLSGQSISDGLLVEVARNWRELRVEEGGRKIRVQPGVIGARANQALAALRREDRSRSGVHCNLHAGRNSLQQLQRDVLRRRAERLPHAALHEVHAAVGNRHRHVAARCRRTSFTRANRNWRAVCWS